MTGGLYLLILYVLLFIYSITHINECIWGEQGLSSFLKILEILLHEMDELLSLLNHSQPVLCFVSWLIRTYFRIWTAGKREQVMSNVEEYNTLRVFFVKYQTVSTWLVCQIKDMKGQQDKTVIPKCFHDGINK